MDEIVKLARSPVEQQESNKVDQGQGQGPGKGKGQEQTPPLTPRKASATGDYAIGGLCMLLWIFIFSAGVLVPAKPYITKLQTGVLESNFFILYLFFATLLFTYTNVAFLTCLAGALGGVSSRITLSNYKMLTGEQKGDISPESLVYRSESPFASICRSFAVYLLYMAGLSIGLNGANPNHEFLIETTPQQYMRIAGFLSTFGFLAGYDPTIFTSILSKFTSFGGQDKPASLP